MKQTNNQLFDFLDFSTDPGSEETLWKAGKPKRIEEQGGDILITIPFQKQKCLNDITPDLTEKIKEYVLGIRAYGEKILRISIGFGIPAMTDSPILEIHPVLKPSPLFIQIEDDIWTVYDENHRTRAVFNLKEPEIDHWSDLLPGPQESVVASFFPDGEKEIKISSYDQFFSFPTGCFCIGFYRKRGK
ncbi:hypothetical protein ES705_43098 [subsurface metagenome]